MIIRFLTLSNALNRVRYSGCVYLLIKELVWKQILPVNISVYNILYYLIILIIVEERPCNSFDRDPRSLLANPRPSIPLRGLIAQICLRARDPRSLLGKLLIASLALLGPRPTIPLWALITPDPSRVCPADLFPAIWLAMGVRFPWAVASLISMEVLGTPQAPPSPPSKTSSVEAFNRLLVELPKKKFVEAAKFIKRIDEIPEISLPSETPI